MTQITTGKISMNIHTYTYVYTVTYMLNCCPTLNEMLGDTHFRPLENENGNVIDQFHWSLVQCVTRIIVWIFVIIGSGNGLSFTYHYLKQCSKVGSVIHLTFRNTFFYQNRIMSSNWICHMQNVRNIAPASIYKMRWSWSDKLLQQSPWLARYTTHQLWTPTSRSLGYHKTWECIQIDLLAHPDTCMGFNRL